MARTQTMNHGSSNRFQSEQLREVRAHLTEAEKRALACWTRRFGIWMLFLAGIAPTTATVHGTQAIIEC